MLLSVFHFYLSVMPEVLPCSLGLLLSLRQRSGYPLASSPIVGLLALLRIEEFGFQLSVNVLFFLLPASAPALKGCTNSEDGTLDSQQTSKSFQSIIEHLKRLLLGFSTLFSSKRLLTGTCRVFRLHDTVNSPPLSSNWLTTTDRRGHQHNLQRPPDHELQLSDWHQTY